MITFIHKQYSKSKVTHLRFFSQKVMVYIILGDPGADKGGEGNSKRVEKNIWNEEK